MVTRVQFYLLILVVFLSTLLYGWYKYENKEGYYIAERVEFIVEGKWGEGYSGKHSSGERLYFKLYSPKYDKYSTKSVHPLTYQDYDKGSHVVFEENQYEMTGEESDMSLQAYLSILFVLWGSLIIYQIVWTIAGSDIWSFIKFKGEH